MPTAFPSQGSPLLPQDQLTFWLKETQRLVNSETWPGAVTQSWTVALLAEGDQCGNRARQLAALHLSLLVPVLQSLPLSMVTWVTD